MADSRWGMFPVPSLIINNIIMTSPLLSQATHVLANLLIFSETLLFKYFTFLSPNVPCEGEWQEVAEFVGCMYLSKPRYQRHKAGFQEVTFHLKNFNPSLTSRAVIFPSHSQPWSLYKQWTVRSRISFLTQRS